MGSQTFQNDNLMCVAIIKVKKKKLFKERKNENLTTSLPTFKLLAMYVIVATHLKAFMYST